MFQSIFLGTARVALAVSEHIFVVQQTFEINFRLERHPSLDENQLCR